MSTRLEDLLTQLAPLLGGAGHPGHGPDIPLLLDQVRLEVGRQLHNDPIFHARVFLAENLIAALKPQDTREGVALLAATLPLVHAMVGPHEPASLSSRLRLDLHIPRSAEADSMSQMVYGYAARLTRERHERLEELCRRSLDDPERRGVLVVRDPATGVETMTLDASVPHCTIHDYPHGKNGHAPQTPDAPAPAQREEHP
jgi:hypothetical protein